MQHILDIDKVEAHQVHPDPLPPNFPLPRKLQKAGYVPDIRDLQPGDLILSSRASRLDLVSRGTSLIQGWGGYFPEHARWTHAAVYLGELFMICEATRDGVRLGTLLDTAASSVFRVRRGQHGAAFIDRETGWRTALFSVAQITKNYDYSQIKELGQLAVTPGFAEYQQKPPKDGDEAAICSVVFQDAYCRATGILLQNTMSREVTPAFLSATDLLKDVPCGWRKLHA